jgi:hypothetical protein
MRLAIFFMVSNPRINGENQAAKPPSMVALRAITAMVAKTSMAKIRIVQTPVGEADLGGRGGVRPADGSQIVTQ